MLGWKGQDGVFVVHTYLCCKRSLDKHEWIDRGNLQKVE